MNRPYGTGLTGAVRRVAWLAVIAAAAAGSACSSCSVTVVLDRGQPAPILLEHADRVERLPLRVPAIPPAA